MLAKVETRTGHDGARQVDRVIEAMYLAEMGPWITRRRDYQAALSEYNYYNAVIASVFLLQIRGGHVKILDKPPFYTRAQLDDESTRISGIKIAITYKKFIQQVVRKTCPDIETTLAIETNDEGIVTNTAPIFVIQKLQGRNSVLLPHFEFIFADFHESENDVIRYYDKSVSAAFFGSTTGGGLVTAHSVRDLSFPRLRSAVFFRNNRRVVFRLSNLVACTPEAEKLLREMGFGEGWRKFSEHFSHRFIISMDGNAGTCSRLTVGLKSNSVVLRSETNHLMHYSSHLIPWLHYIPIRSDSEIEAVLDWEQREPGRFQYIAEQGTRFFANYLTREQVSNYMGGLIRSYAQIFAPI